MTQQEQFVKAEKVSEIYPGLTKSQLATLRYTGKGPRYYSPTPRVILYKLSEVQQWIEESGRTSTAEVA